MAQPIGRAHPTAGTPNGLTRGRAASRSPDAADSPPISVVFSKCGMEKEGGKSDAIISSRSIPISFRNLISLIVKVKHLQFPNSSWCPPLVAWSSIPRVMRYYLFLETFGFKKNVQNLNLPKVKTQELQFQSWRKIVVFHPFVTIQYNECRWMLILNRKRWWKN